MIGALYIHVKQRETDINYKDAAVTFLKIVLIAFPVAISYMFHQQILMIK